MNLKYTIARSFTVALLAFLGLAAQAQESDPAIETPAPEETAEPIKVQRVTAKGGTLVAVAEGETFNPTNSVALPFDVRVKTNLTFTVAGGAVRKLQEGQTISADGTLQDADGSVQPVMNHVVMRDGKPRLVKDGVASVVQAATQLGNGTMIEPDGTMVGPTGRRSRLLDGQLFKLDGESLPAIDTATIKNGSVVLQKDGSTIILKPAQMMMMSDGTKVFGDGKVERRNGDTFNLTDGEVLRIDGVRR